MAVASQRGAHGTRKQVCCCVIEFISACSVIIGTALGIALPRDENKVTGSMSKNDERFMSNLFLVVRLFCKRELFCASGRNCGNSGLGFLIGPSETIVTYSIPITSGVDNRAMKSAFNRPFRMGTCYLWAISRQEWRCCDRLDSPSYGVAMIAGGELANWRIGMICRPGNGRVAKTESGRIGDAGNGDGLKGRIKIMIKIRKWGFRTRVMGRGGWPFEVGIDRAD
jgi:hypothetical protein